MRNYLLFLALIFAPFNCLAKTQNLQDFGLAISEKTPAFAMLIVQNGKTLVKNTDGCARLDGKAKKCTLKANNDTAFAIASVTKHFTAAGILMLEEDGKLSIEDEISKYLGLPAQFQGVKIKHLIFHTSGIPNYSWGDDGDEEIFLKNGKKITADEAILKIFQREFKPRDVEFAYSNSGYTLLGKIIEKVSGKSYESFMKERIFNPLGMKNTFVTTSIEAQKNYTFQYSAWPILQEQIWQKVDELTSEGGIWTSINDYEKWLRAFDNNKIFQKKTTMEKFLSHGKHDSGKNVIPDGEVEMNYGFGIGHKNAEKFKGKAYKIITHNGGMPGTAALFGKILDKNIWLVYFNNNGAYPQAFELLEATGVNFDS